TEVHPASNCGSLEAATISRAPLVKIWVARAGARPAHAAASGQRQQLDDVFIVGGYSMDHPGDWRGGAPARRPDCQLPMHDEIGGAIETGAGRAARGIKRLKR